MAPQCIIEWDECVLLPLRMNIAKRYNWWYGHIHVLLLQTMLCHFVASGRCNIVIEIVNRKSSQFLLAFRALCLNWLFQSMYAFATSFLVWNIFRYQCKCKPISTDKPTDQPAHTHKFMGLKPNVISQNDRQNAHSAMFSVNAHCKHIIWNELK